MIEKATWYLIYSVVKVIVCLKRKIQIFSKLYHENNILLYNDQKDKIYFYLYIEVYKQIKHVE